MAQTYLKPHDGGWRWNSSSDEPSISPGGTTPGFLGRRFAMALAGLAGLGALALDTDQALAASDTGTANAKIIAPITIAAILTLEFGQIVTGASASVVRVTPAGARSLVSGDATLAGGTFRAATFNITGEPSTTYAITLPGGSATLTGTPSGTMTVDTLVSSPSATGTLSGGGTETISVGADLNVGASQAVGSYTGTFAVTVDYN